jgi:hypothetical protein
LAAQSHVRETFRHYLREQADGPPELEDSRARKKRAKPVKNRLDETLFLDKNQADCIPTSQGRFQKFDNNRQGKKHEH